MTQGPSLPGQALVAPWSLQHEGMSLSWHRITWVCWGLTF